MAYGSLAGVAALVPRYANAAGVFDDTTTPAAADVAAWLAQISAMLDVAIAAYGLATPVAHATVTPMLDGFANAQAAAMTRGVNGQGKLAEKPLTADEMLLAISADAATWVRAWSNGIGALLGVTAADADAVVTIGTFTRRDGFTERVSEYALEDALL